MVDEECKEVNPLLWWEEIQIYFGASKSKDEENESLKPFSIIEEDHEPLSSSSGQE